MFSPKVQTRQTDGLVDALLCLSDKEEAYRFLEDILTVQEFLSVAQRLEVAKLLLSGAKYHEIAAQTGASSATISRVNRTLLYGAGGYHHILSVSPSKQKENQ